jgi:hypothetical protein
MRQARVTTSMLWSLPSYSELETPVGTGDVDMAVAQVVRPKGDCRAYLRYRRIKLASSDDRRQRLVLVN